MNIWPYITFILISALLLPFIEWCRWRNEYGNKTNLDKQVTAAIAVAAWLLMCWFFNLFAWPVLLFAGCCIGIRGMFYDPALNLFFDRYIDEESTTTNSKTDQHEQKLRIPFWWQRAIYTALAIAGAWLYEHFK